MSFVCPHFPLIAPPEFYDRYPLERIPLPKQYLRQPSARDHPYLRDYDACVGYDAGFGGDHAKVRRAIAGYLGLVSFMDDNVGKVLRALDDAGLAGDTRVVYTSDHGDNVGARGLWGKSTHVRGVGRRAADHRRSRHCRRRACATPGKPRRPLPVLSRRRRRARRRRHGYHGVSPLALAAGGDPDRAVVSEYHAIGSTGGITMLRKGRWKYVHCVRYRPQLFDLESDPGGARRPRRRPGCSAHARRDSRPSCAASAIRTKSTRARKRRQAELLARYGGREAALARGDLNYTPAPGPGAGHQLRRTP